MVMVARASIARQARFRCPAHFNLQELWVGFGVELEWNISWGMLRNDILMKEV